ncbi:hypothetical protein C1752_14783 [Acaryochloris thomasi RCC1774]|uniref:Uncharacterized protein n=1 Tax=Acaryochloris thomasi RCC1774 TaxID=1764569 RepID=A0A2W1J7T0_9CYAN|nr:hypothetical protein C1752_14783 [Acaryochloris thomasi RCC1774]
MSNRGINNYLAGYFNGHTYFTFIRLLCTFPGITASVLLYLYVTIVYPAATEARHLTWSTKDLRYLKSEKITLKEKCERRNMSTRTGNYVRDLMCSPTERWYLKEKRAIRTTVVANDLGLKEWSSRGRKLRSEYRERRQWEKRNPDHPSIMKSNNASPRPVYDKEKGWTIK